MALPAEHLIVCPVLIGRQEHLAALDRAVGAASSGAGQVIAIAGEAGLGKSRLVGEAKSRATEGAGAGSRRVLQGNCFEPDASLPYAPILDLLRGCIATSDQAEVIECLGPDASEIVKVLPELTSFIAGLQPASPLDPDQEKRRVFQALCQFFARAAAKHPLLVVLEDLHWIDDTSLEFLALLARRIRTLPVLMVLTFRSDEVQPALRQFLVGLERERLVVEWPLARLSSPEISEMITAIFDLETPARQEFVDALYSLTEGNPFFLEEVLKSLVSAGDIFFAAGTWDRKPIEDLRIPRSVQAAVAARTEHLSPSAQRVLTLAAVAGRRFDFALLQRLADREEHELLETIKELINAQLVVEESAEHFAFRHALTQQAIHSAMLARERRGLHRQIAETMRDVYAKSIDAHLPDLAHHFYAAESWDEAYYYCRRVGENAQTLNAAGAAAEQFTRAMTSATHLGIAIPSSLHRARGQAFDTLGDFEDARRDYEAALESARAEKDGGAEWQSLIDLGFLWSGRDYERTGTYFTRASELADALGVPLLRARSLNRLGNWLVNVGVPLQGLAHHQAALAIFEEAGDTLGTADTLDLIGMANGIYGDLPASVDAFGRAIALLRPLGPSLALSSSLASRSTYLGQNLAEPVYAALGSVDDLKRDAVEAKTIAEKMGSPAAMSYSEWARGASQAAYGELSAGLAHALEGVRIAEDIGHDQWITGARFSVGRVYLFMQAYDLALEYFEEALRLAREVGSAWWIGNVATNLAETHLLRGDRHRAEASLASVRPPDEEPRNLPDRRMQYIWGLLALHGGDGATALSIADRLVSDAPGDAHGQRIPSLELLRGDALAVLGRSDEALSALGHARDGAIQRSTPPLLWRVHRSLGGLHQAQRHVDDATREFSAARDLIDSLAMNIDQQHLREGFLASALASLPKPRSPSANQAAKEAFGGLTAREREVASLIAKGMSNRDIAEHLVLGERTIETHVGNVLSKLGFTSRAQIAAWAVEKGLSQAG